MKKKKSEQQDINQPRERLSAIVERVTYHSDATGFCVLRVRAKQCHDMVTVVGYVASIAPGETIKGTGSWIQDKKHGLQFKATQLEVIQPTSLEGIEKYLGSGMVKGIGPFFAKKLVTAFGEAVFDVIEQQPERLMELEGIGDKRKEQVLAAWAEQKSIRNIMVFLQAHGVGTARAVRIYKTYGDQAIEQVRDNPYRLAQDIHGIGFKTADALAERLGIEKDSILRAEAGVRHVLQGMCEHGHCAAEYDQLITDSVALLDIPEPIIKAGLARQVTAENLIVETINGVACVYPISLYQAETGVAKHLQRIKAGSTPLVTGDLASLIPWVEKKTGLLLSDSQKAAIQAVLKHKLSIITGGPGVGKTTVVNSILKILQAEQQSVMLCAPTGRAAKRLSETTGMLAKTIHRTLEFDPKKYAFRHDQNHPLACDVLIVDESSMIDIVLLYHLLKAVPDETALIFVGDVDQLPSVGPGTVLRDMIQSTAIVTVRLTEIFRQALHSKIILNAHRINQGFLPASNEKESDFYTIYVDSPEEIEAQLLSLVTKRLVNHYHCNPVTDIQVLTPMNRGGLGTQALNVSLQKQLNGQAEPTVSRFGTTFAPGDKVIQLVNNYDKEVFNGDIGFITQVNLEDGHVNIMFDQRVTKYELSELDEIGLAYAISIHKSQGSEFPIVVLPVSTQHYALLAKNLLYTGVTRGKKLVIVVGQKKAVWMAINNKKSATRLTNLAARLKVDESLYVHEA